MCEENNIILDTPIEKRIKKETFIKIIGDLKEVYDRDCAIHEASGGALELVEYADKYLSIIDAISEIVFTASEWDTITWYLYEKVEKDIWLGEKRGEHTPIAKLNNVEDLWEYLVLGYNKVVISEEEYNKLIQSQKDSN